MKRIVLFLCLVSIFSYARAATLGQIRNDVRYRVLDTLTVSHNTRYTDDFLNYRINEVQKEIIKATYPAYTSNIIATTAGVGEYFLSSDTLRVDKVVYMINSSTSSYQKLAYSTIQSLDTDRGLQWEALPPSRPMNYYFKGNIIGLVPRPSAAYATNYSLKIYYYHQTAQLVNDDDIAFGNIYVMQPYCSLITDGVVIKCQQDKGADWSNAYTAWQAGIAAMKNDINSTRPASTVINVTNP